MATKRLTLFLVGLACFAVANFFPDLINQFSLNVAGYDLLNNLGQNVLSLIGGVIVCKAIFKD